jgi:uncharacterized protein YndB with AHSA1/START domain
MRFRLFAAAFVALTQPMAAAQAEVAAASSTAFTVHGERTIAASPEHAWRAAGRIGQWWDSAHTYSGDARRLSLEARAGGCFCERWDGQSVEHARVVLVMEREGVRTIRLLGALGPLQESGAAGVLTITVAPEGEGAKLAMDYRVSGDASLGLDAIAPLVDSVLMTQLERLSQYAATGRRP